MIRPSPDVVRPPTANALSSVCRERALPPPREGMNRGLSGGVVVPLSTWTGAYLPLQEAASSCQRDSLGAVIRASQYGGAEGEKGLRARGCQEQQARTR